MKWLFKKKNIETIVIPKFKKGETLRLTIEVQQIGESPGNPNGYGIAFDPKGRTSTFFPGTGDDKETTTLQVQIPFKLDIR